MCDVGQIGDVDNSIKVTLDGLWVHPDDPLAGRLPLDDDDLVQQVIASRLNVNESQPDIGLPELTRAVLSAAASDRPSVYIRVDEVAPMERLLA